MDKGNLRLNNPQKEAVAYDDGSLLIVAGAGTGKTSTLVSKIHHLTTTKNVPSDKILCLTFTEKASNEMTERIDLAMPYGYFPLSISTFHGFADTVLKREIAQIGLSPGYTLMTQAESVLFIRKNLFHLNLNYYRPASNPTKFIESLLQHFSRLQDEDVEPKTYVKWVKSQQNQLSSDEFAKLDELSNAYHTYSNLKIEHEVCDFSDLITHLLRTFRTRQSILEAYRTQYTHILVDEFQDTNIAQYELIKLLAPPNRNPHLTVVGDDSQAIYKFRGASISNILSFMKDYPTAHQISLNDNYRSNQQILDRAYTLIKKNDPDTLESRLGISKKLRSHQKSVHESVQFAYFGHGSQESKWVIEQIIELKKKHTYRFSDFCILVRANTHSEGFTNEMKSQGVPFQFHGPGTLFKRPEIKDCIAFLTLLTQIEDSVAMYRLVSMKIFQIDPQDIALVLAFAKKTSRPLYQAIEICCAFFHPAWMQDQYEQFRQHLPLIKENTRSQLIKLITLIKKNIARISDETALHLLYQFLEDIEYFKYTLTLPQGYSQEVIQHVAQFLGKLRTLENKQEISTVFDAVSYIQMSVDLGESPLTAEVDATEKDAVHVMTVHGAKGLEFPVVFLPHLIQGRFPTYERKESIPIPEALIREELPQGDYHLQEERRLFYVGMTRAKERLFLTASELYDDGQRKRKISPFVVEAIGQEEVNAVMQKKSEEHAQLSIFDFQKEPIHAVTSEVLYSPPIKNLSFTQLQSYEMCPLQYKYQYILRIPTPQAAAASFGSTIHIVLQKFYETFRADPTVGKETLLSLIEMYWIPLGYSSTTHEAQRKVDAIEMLTRFYDTFHLPEINVISLEKMFRIKIEHELSITGKIDRVDRGTNNTIEIVDYKTGKTPDEKELKKSMQLSIYALAASEKTLFNTPVSNVRLTLYYLQDMKKFTSTRTDGDLIEVKQKVKTIAKQINSGIFTPRTGPWCNFCPFRLICEAW